MKKVKFRYHWFFTLGVVFAITVVIFFLSKPKSHRSFVEIPLKTFENSDFYYFEAEIEKQKVPLFIDTGLQFPISLQKDTLKKIKNKKRKGISEWSDANGKIFEEPYYKIDLMRFEKVNFENILVREKSTDSIFFAGKVLAYKEKISDKISCFIKEEIEKKVGYFGSNAFRVHDWWLVDFPNSKMYFIVKFEDTLKRLHKSLCDFTKIPLLDSNSHLIVHVETDLGKKTFMIDSGAEYTIMKCPSEDFSEYQTFTTNRFSLGDFDFGKQDIYFYNFSEKFTYDGIIGIDFLKDKSLLLDFKHNRMFINCKNNH